MSRSAEARAAGPQAAPPERVSVTVGLLALWRLSRPEVWMVSFLPLYVGHLLATRELVPGLPRLTALWTDATSDGLTFGQFVHGLRMWGIEQADFLLAMLVMGPLLWLATLLWNDVVDIEGDRGNPRKARSPLVQGLVSAGWAWRMSFFAAAATLAVAWQINVAFFLLTLANLVLAYVYSVPPLRLKTRPGADVAVNAIGVGFVSALAGWVITAPASAFPYEFAWQGILVAVAVYVPTTLFDYDADVAAGYTTLATHLGVERAYRIGWYAWLGANAGAIALSWTDRVIPRAMLPLLVIFVPLLIWQYHAFIGKAGNPVARFQGIVLCSFTFLAVNFVFALMYTGIWVAN